MDDEVLWTRYWRYRADRDRDRLAKRNLHVVDECLLRFPSAFRNHTITADDLRNEGYLGLIQAIERWDPGQGPFKQYAARRVWGAMQDLFRSWDWVPRSVRRRIKAGEAIPAQADAPIHLDAYHDDDQELSLINLIAAEPDVHPMDTAEAVAALQRLKAEHPRLYTVVCLFANDHKGPYIAEQLGITESRVSQLRSAARQKLVDYGWDAAARQNA